MDDLALLDKLSMLNETISHVGIIASKAMIDSQTTLQLLVTKGIATRGEIDFIRERVKRNTEYGELLMCFSELVKDLEYTRKTSDLMTKLYKEGANSLTQEELDQVSDALNEMINGGDR